VSRVLKELIIEVPVVSLAKRLEEVYKKEGGKVRKVRLSLNSPALHLLQYVRDEAHRFAAKYHRILRGKEMKKSILDEISGIGNKRKQKLLKHFGSVEKIKESSMEELKRLGIPVNIAGKILEIQ
jgi:excinuclease ABC subunit C